MPDDFLGQFLANPARAKILRIFVFNPNESFTLGRLAQRAATTRKVALREITLLEKWGLIKKGKFAIMLRNGKIPQKGKQQKEPTWTVNISNKMLSAVTRFVYEASPLQHKNLIDTLRKGGRLSSIILSGSFVGDASRPVDIIMVGQGFKEKRLEAAMRTLESQVGRELRYSTFTIPEFHYRLTIQDRLVRDTIDFPHIVLLDRPRLLSMERF